MNPTIASALLLALLSLPAWAVQGAPELSHEATNPANSDETVVLKMRYVAWQTAAGDVDVAAGGAVGAFVDGPLGPRPPLPGTASAFALYYSTVAPTGSTPAAMAAWIAAETTQQYILPAEAVGDPGVFLTLVVTPPAPGELRALTGYHLSMTTFHGEQQSAPSPAILVTTLDDATPPGDFGMVTAGAPAGGASRIDMYGLPADDGVNEPSGAITEILAWDIDAGHAGLTPPPSGAGARNDWFLAHESLWSRVNEPSLTVPGAPGAANSQTFDYHATGKRYLAIAAMDNGLVPHPAPVGSRGNLNTVTILEIDFTASTGGGPGGAEGASSSAAKGCSAAGGGSLAIFAALAGIAVALKRAD